MLKTALIFSSRVALGLQEEYALSEKKKLYLATQCCSQLDIDNSNESLRINHDYPQQKTTWIPSATQDFRIYPQLSQR